MAESSKIVKPGSDDAILQEIRERWDDASSEWRPIRDEGRTDMRYLAGDPWEPKDRRAREDAGRPVIALDELNQYTNQIINDIRQNKRAIKVTPIGNGANDDTARLREGLFRQIEYRSNAQQAYTTMFENAVQRGYGFLKVVPRYVSDDSPDQELIIEAIPNPDTVTIDPWALKPDGADMRYAFISEIITEKEFKRQFPKAQIVSFDGDTIKDAPNWFPGENRLRIADYWSVEEGEPREKLWLRTQTGVRAVWADDLPKNQPFSTDLIVNRRTIRPKKVMFYKTNGVEILHKEQWCPERTLPNGATLKAVTSIPIVVCLGKILWVDEGGGTKRVLLSMVRLARDPAMLLCYIATCKAEVVGGVPRNAWLGYEGQFRGHETDFQKANHEPVPYLEVKPHTAETMGQILPLPVRQNWDPPIQNLEIAQESARRSIQAAVGSMPLPSQAQRQNEKSGIALQRIKDTTQQGSYHFIDHYDDALIRTGAILDELIPHYADGERELATREADETTKLVKVNGDGPDDLRTDVGNHDITLSTGPAKDSEREAANDFADTLVSTPALLEYLPPPARPKLLALAIRLKDVGPLGDQMAEIIDPPPPGANMTPEQQAKMSAQAMQENQHLKQQLSQAAQIIQTEQVKQQATLQGKQMEIASRERIAAQDRAAKIEIARITASKQAADELREDAEERLALGVELAHETDQNAIDRQHDVNMAQMGQQHALEQGQQAAALQPAPEASAE